ncbi:MAG TPA: PH domain-containing protein [Symbiobacteriaceae bacterium]|nr:PH domain-containing protein [Symbiobacteriaceae bacterium]
MNGKAVKYTLVAIVLAFVGLTWYSYSTSMSYTATDTALTISYQTIPLGPKTVYIVNYDEVQRVELYSQAPPMRKRFGSNMGKLRVGTFSSTDLGDFRAAINDITRPLLYIKTPNQAFMISPADAAALRQTIESKK